LVGIRDSIIYVLDLYMPPYYADFSTLQLPYNLLINNTCNKTLDFQLTGLINKIENYLIHEKIVDTDQLVCIFS
jgi:hypothetical protein